MVPTRRDNPSRYSYLRATYYSVTIWSPCNTMILNVAHGLDRTVAVPNLVNILSSYSFQCKTIGQVCIISLGNIQLLVILVL